MFLEKIVLVLQVLSPLGTDDLIACLWPDECQLEGFGVLNGAYSANML